MPDTPLYRTLTDVDKIATLLLGYKTAGQPIALTLKQLPRISGGLTPKPLSMLINP